MSERKELGYDAGIEWRCECRRQVKKMSKSAQRTLEEMGNGNGTISKLKKKTGKSVYKIHKDFTEIKTVMKSIM